MPGAADTVTFDGSSGGGTVTLNFGGTISITSIAMGAFTGTFDNSVNNNNMNLSLSATAFQMAGSGLRNIKLGSATYTLSGANATFSATVVTNLTFTGGSATIAFTGTTGTRHFNTATSLTFGTVTFAGSSGNGICAIESSCTIGTLTVGAPNYLTVASNETVTVSTALTLTGSTGSEIAVMASAVGTSATVAAPASQTFSWCAFRDMTFTGSPTANDSFNLLHNSGITINAPGGSGTTITGGVGVIGS